MCIRDRRTRNYQPLLLIDLSVPRNIASDVDDIEDAYLFNVDDLRSVQTRGRELREVAAEDARLLVEQEAERFMNTLAEFDVSERIGDLVRHFEGVRAKEIAKSQRLLDGLEPEQKQALDAMTRALVKKLLHHPLQEVRRAARQGDAEAVDLVLRAFREEE